MAEAIIWRIAKMPDDFPKDGKLWGVDGELDKLKEIVSTLQYVVHDADKWSVDSREIEAWLEELKAASYDAENLLEEWSIEAMRRELPSKYEKLKQVITSFSPNPLARVRKIRKGMETIAAKGKIFNLRECAEDVQDEGGSRNRERSDSFANEEEIIGRDDDKSAIMKLLLDSDTEEQIPVLSIHGADGIGKTALARCLYKVDMVNQHFDLTMWVSLGFDSYDPRMVLRQIIESVITEKADDLQFEQLKNQLMEHICGKKCLLVMEDVRLSLPEQWESMKSSLTECAEGSKILITSRDQPNGPVMGTTSAYILGALSESSSLKLLMRMACTEEENGDSKKLTIERRIVKSCHGIPLYIRTIGSILFFKKTEAEWLHFERQTKMAAEETDAFVNFHVEFCYRHLPFPLKQCFVFCSLFPRDWVIDKLMLTSLWMAVGFIQAIDSVDQDMEDVAHNYFMDLLRRNFFQDCTKDELGNVTSCKMHRLVYNQAQKVARTEYSLKSGRPRLLINKRTRHVLWDSSLDFSRGLPTTLLRAKHLRTFIKLDKRQSWRCGTRLGEITLREFISKFKFLRVLDWQDSGIGELPSSICELKHLTFLDLSENEGIVSLPDSTTRLQNLQVLKLNMCYNLIELPSNIRKLAKGHQKCHKLCTEDILVP